MKLLFRITLLPDVFGEEEISQAQEWLTAIEGTRSRSRQDVKNNIKLIVRGLTELILANALLIYRKTRFYTTCVHYTDHTVVFVFNYEIIQFLQRIFYIMRRCQI